jgi:hypothetical protein
MSQGNRVMQMSSTIGRIGRVALGTGAVLAAVSCASEFTRSGRSPAFLVIDKLEAASGAKATDFGSQLNSDVITLVKRTVAGKETYVATIFNDLGKATMRLGLKNPGTTELPASPTGLNEITVTRYRVDFRRADGRNRPGVDVPYGFDGAVTATITTKDAISFGFDLVRFQMKEEPPLLNLEYGGGANIISTIAEIKFYGHDQAGNEVSATGSITVNFGDFADPVS